MARRIRFVKADKQQKMIWQTPGGMGLFIILCVMMVLFIQWMPSLMKAFAPPAKAPGMPDQPSATEEMQPKEAAPKPKVAPKPYVALMPEEEKKLLASVVDQAPLEKKPYFHLLAKVNAMTEAQMDAAVDPAITYDTFAEPGGPASARGKAVRLQGLLLRLKETKITDSLASGFDSVWEGNIIDNELRVTTFVLTQPPKANFLTPKDDTVVLKGIYLKNIVYRDRSGGFTASPMIIAKELVKIVPPPAKMSFWIRYKEPLILLVIIVGVMGVALLEHRRRVASAVSGLPRRTSSEPMDLVVDEGQQEDSEAPIQHVNPGPGKETEGEKKGEKKEGDGKAEG